MKVLFLIVSLMSLSAWSSVEKCGDHPLEKKYPDLTWIKLTDVFVYTAFSDIDAAICIGKKAYSSEVERVTYRDNQGRAELDETIGGLKEGRVLIGSENLPAAAIPFVRRGPIMALRIDKVTNSPEKGIIRFDASIRFLRNLSKGFSGKDYREVPVIAYLNFETDTVSGEYVGKDKTVNFDTISIFLSSVPIKITQLQLFQKKQQQAVLFATELKEVDGFFN